MTNDEFLNLLQAEAATLAGAVAADDGEWIIKGFIDVYRRILHDFGGYQNRVESFGDSAFALVCRVRRAAQNEAPKTGEYDVRLLLFSNFKRQF